MRERVEILLGYPVRLSLEMDSGWDMEIEGALVFEDGKVVLDLDRCFDALDSYVKAGMP